MDAVIRMNNNIMIYANNISDHVDLLFIYTTNTSIHISFLLCASLVYEACIRLQINIGSR